MARVLAPLRSGSGNKQAFSDLKDEETQQGVTLQGWTAASGGNERIFDAILDSTSKNSQTKPKPERTLSGTHLSKRANVSPSPSSSFSLHQDNEITSVQTHEQESSYVPLSIWNAASAQSQQSRSNMGTLRNTPSAHLDLDERPFVRSSTKQNSGSIRKIMERVIEGSRSKATSMTSPNAEMNDASLRPKAAAPSRADAILLCKAYKLMLSNIRQGNKDPQHQARQAARDGRAEDLMAILEPELFVMDTVLAELVNQIKVSCVDRGNLLEEMRLQVLEFFSVLALGLQQLYAKHLQAHQTSSSFDHKVDNLEAQNQKSVQQMSAMTIEMKAKDEKIKYLSEELETVKRKSQTNSSGALKSRSNREIELELQLQELKDLDELYKSQLNLVEAREKKAEQNNAALQAQIIDLQGRVRRDAEEIECLSEEKARHKVRATWLHVLLLVRRAPRERQEASTQDGEGIGKYQDIKTSGSVEKIAEDGHTEQATKITDISRKALFGRDAVISFPMFWEGMVSNAHGLDLEVDAPHLKMIKKELLEFISKIYTNKILADEQDDRAHFPRENLPEFLYEHHLETFGDSVKASEALVRLIANLRLYAPLSARVRMFCRFLNLIADQPVIPEAINVYLLSLVKLQSGFVPLLPAYDGVHVAAAKAVQTVDYIFAQAPYVVRSKILLEVERKMQGKHTDLDSLLAYIVEQYMEEAGKGEERLKAIFVAADTDSDGQLEYSEYIKMMNHLGNVQNYRKLMRMYAEMTLSRMVTSNVFVQVCRKWKALLFEPGPAIKRIEKNASEVFALLNSEWAKLETIVHELLVVLEGTPIGRRMEEHVKLLRAKLGQKLEVEQAWHCYRSIVAEFTSAVKNRTPGFGFPNTDDQAVENALQNVVKARPGQNKRKASRATVKSPAA